MIKVSLLYKPSTKAFLNLNQSDLGVLLYHKMPKKSSVSSLGRVIKNVIERHIVSS